MFRDSTGAEYRLNVNTNGMWTSKEAGLYVEYDTTVSPPRLYFPDGTFWVFGCLSAGPEGDAGAVYTTLIEDSNGNQITVTYAAGRGVAWNNSSGRMTQITDIGGTTAI